MSETAFTTLKLNDALIQNLSTLGYHQMTPIQSASLPSILEGKDVIGQAKTGSGKTAAFGLGLLERLDVSQYRIQSLVLCPTRELADQVSKEIRSLARAVHNVKVLTLCGGTPFGPQAGSLEHGAHIIVGTPGRIEEHLRKGKLDLQHLTVLVLDEADRMLDMGFQESLDAIIDQTPSSRQSLLFSATYPPGIQSIARRIMTDPVIVQVEATHDEQTIQQVFFAIDKGTTRITALRLLLLKYRFESTLVFCNTRRETQEVANQLRQLGFSVQALHGDLDQKDRDQTLVQFTNRSISVLVATDVAARGLDIDSVDAVINFEIARDLEVHVHRIGRTGRAGNTGMAITLFTPDDHYKFKSLEDFLEQDIDTKSLPTLSSLDQTPYDPPMSTLQIGGGKKQKVRAGDILGALTTEYGIDGKQVGKIAIYDNWAFVAVNLDVINKALKVLSEGKIKGRSFRIRKIRA